ncbi:unnamed protein product, partial [Mesorhabditis belari]|uniref:Uncharacterized protein n=1 Tax=Mesorhabditis belari TaxID=2138241 RepID=A0AAF3FNK1_9BILA
MAEELVEIDCILTTHRYLNFITAPSVLYIGLFANLGVSKICQISLQTFLLIEFVVALLGAIFEKGQAVLPDHHWAKFGRRKALVTEIFWYSHPLFLLEPIVYAIWAANDEKVAFNEQIQASGQRAGRALKSAGSGRGRSRSASTRRAARVVKGSRSRSRKDDKAKSPKSAPKSEKKRRLTADKE